MRSLLKLGLAVGVFLCHLPMALAVAVRGVGRPAVGGQGLVVVSPFEPGETSGGARAVKDFLTLLGARRGSTLIVVSALQRPRRLMEGLGNILSWPISVPPQCRPLLTGPRRLTERLDGADTVIFEHFSGALCLFRGRPAVRRIVIRDHEVQLRKIEMERQRTRGLDWMMHSVRLASCSLISRPIFAAADSIVTLTAEDRDALVGWYPFLADRTVTIPVPFEETASPAGDAMPPGPARDLLMIGNFFHRPNVDALQWFLARCAPHLTPGFTLHLCGLDAPLDAVNLVSSHLAVVRHGFVDDVVEAVPGASIAVAPVISGGGVRIKNLLLASLGKAVVTTSLGNEGIGFVDRRDAVVTDDGREMAQRINELACTPQELARLGRSGREFVRAHFGHQAILERLEREVLV
jgi:glycosyltransferase involved in cell wall biosynthesis